MAHDELQLPEPRPAPLPMEPLPVFPRSCFRPGAVVWAKVEGHDWWPARVVRRRAVPREVGPPPGAPLSHIPVVFFTAKGIPGEDTSALNSLEGAMAACVRAMQISGMKPSLTCALTMLHPLQPQCLNDNIIMQILSSVLDILSSKGWRYFRLCAGHADQKYEGLPQPCPCRVVPLATPSCSIERFTQILPVGGFFPPRELGAYQQKR